MNAPSVKAGLPGRRTIALFPGSTLSLDAHVSERIWKVYLAGVGRTHIEIAPHTAVAHALSYIERAQPGDRLLFCIGEQDLAEPKRR